MQPLEVACGFSRIVLDRVRMKTGSDILVSVNFNMTNLERAHKHSWLVMDGFCKA